MSDEVCSWCTPDSEGNTEIATFTDPQTQSEVIVTFRNVHLEITLTAHGKFIGHMAHEIEYCPFCGRKTKRKVTEDENAQRNYAGSKASD